MPRGTPNKGYRLTRKRIAEGFDPTNYAAKSTVKDNFPYIHSIGKEVTREVVSRIETDEQIDERIAERFGILEHLIDASLDGEARAVIVSGPAGLGKSFTVETKLAEWDAKKRNHTIVKGFVKATGLFKTLYQYRKAGQVIVFDDADSIFHDDTCLNFLKAVCDTNETRNVSYLSEGRLFDEDSNTMIPKTFEFNGTIIFITNYDFDSLIEKGNKLTPHLQALMSRAHYIDLAMKNSRDYLIRIKQVIQTGLLKDRDLTSDQEAEVIDFIEHNISSLRELSLRSALKIAALRKKGGRWQHIAKITCCKK